MAIMKSLASSALGALGLASAGASRLPSLTSRHRRHPQLVRRALGDLPHRRRAEVTKVEGREDEDRWPRQRAAEGGDCPGTPFLWKINDDGTGEHVGFGVGTMHLPLDLVTTLGAANSIEYAIADSCDVYGELNLVSANVTAKYVACGIPHQEASARVADIPDENLRAEYEAKLIEVVTLVLSMEDPPTSDPEVLERIASRLLDLPLLEVQEIILYGNTPEYREKYLQSILSDNHNDPMDAHLLALGRPAKDLEDVATHCEILRKAHPTGDELAQNFDDFSADIKNSLEASLTEEIDLYECGDIKAFAAALAGGMVAEGDYLLSDRNARMASRMVDALRASPDEKVMFAVGVAHWIGGDESLEALLRKDGYSLEHVPNWESDHAEDHLNERCGAMLNPDDGLFVPAPGPFFEGTGEPTHSVVKPTFYEEDNSTGFELTLVDTKDEGEDGDIEGDAAAEGTGAATPVATPVAKETPSGCAAAGASKIGVVMSSLVYIFGMHLNRQY